MSSYYLPVTVFLIVIVLVYLLLFFRQKSSKIEIKNYDTDHYRIKSGDDHNLGNAIRGSNLTPGGKPLADGNKGAENKSNEKHKDGFESKKQ